MVTAKAQLFQHSLLDTVWISCVCFKAKVLPGLNAKGGVSLSFL